MKEQALVFKRPYNFINYIKKNGQLAVEYKKS